MTIKQIETKINGIQSKVDNELLDLQSQLDKAEDTIKTAQNNMQKAEDETNPEAYMKANSDLKRAKVLVQMYKNKIKKLEETALISREEYVSLKNEIINVLNENNRNTAEKLKPILKELEILKNEIAQDFNRGNNLLVIVQRELFKVPTMKQYIKGDKKSPFQADDEYRDRQVVFYLEDLVNKTTKAINEHGGR